MIFIIRANHANEFELQNYAPLAKNLDIKVITSHNTLTPITLPTIPLWSPADFNFPYQKQILNRLIGGEQWLAGLSRVISPRSIVHTAETYTPYTHQVVQLRKEGVIKKLICTCWETIPHNNEKFARLRQWKADAYQCVDLFHTPTQRAKQALVAEGVDPKKIVVIPSGIDLQRFFPRPHAPHKRPLVLTVARLEREKGMQDVEVVAELLPDFDFMVVGKGSYKPRGENIKVTSVPYRQIHTVYQSADLFFLPSRTTATWEEQYGMALVEAMACSLSIVTTQTGAISEVVGSVGITLREGDTTSMAKAIKGLFKKGSAHETMSKAGLSRARSLYDRDKVARKLAKLYQ